MVAVSDFSGLASSICALASAPAIKPMVSLERCMGGLPIMKFKADGAGFRAFGADTVPDGFLGVLRHQLLLWPRRSRDGPLGSGKTPRQIPPRTWMNSY